MLAEAMMAMEALPEKERYVLRALFIEDLTRDETADRLGVTSARIAQIAKKGIARLRGKVFARRKRIRLVLAGAKK